MAFPSRFPGQPANPRAPADGYSRAVVPYRGRHPRRVYLRLEEEITRCDDSVKRVAIIGNGGGGKSLLAQHMGRALGLPVYAIDDVQWQPGWVPTPREEVARMHTGWLAQPGWIIDGWGGWDLLTERFAAADAIVFVDFPLTIHYWWAIKRQVEVTLGLRHDWPPKGCKALPITGRLLRVLSRVHRELRPQLVATLSEPRVRERVVHLRRPRELRRFRERFTISRVSV